MADTLLTLRTVPAPFRPTLFATDGDTLSQWSWNLSSARPVDLYSFPFTPPSRGAKTSGIALFQNAEYASHSSRRRLEQGGHLESGPSTVSHSAERVARAIVRGASSPRDLRTLNDWGQHVGVSRGALRVWCAAAGVPARSCLDFLRVLRAVLTPSHETWDLLSILDVVDQRSLTQLMSRGGIREMRQRRPSLSDFLARQRFIQHQRLVQAIRRQLRPAR